MSERAPPATPTLAMFAFALTIFTGAFLLFQIQPLIGKYILPWFGGAPGVWTTCMLFFQMLLLGGYAYAHALSRRVAPRTQAIVHGVLLVAALASLPITPGDHWKPQAAGDPTWRILALLLASLGLPYLVLAATGPLMQEWFRRLTPGASPYRLYALSNVGSLLALVSYPFFFEMQFTRATQARMWSWGLVAYAVCCGFCAYRLWRQPVVAATASAVREEKVPAPTLIQRLLWMALPACGSVLLLAVTNKMCQDVAVIPFLWVLLLALYLVTFIICFDSPRWYSRFYWTLALAVATVLACVALHEGADMPIVRQVAIYSGVMFVACMICHGEVYRLKPHPRHLTSFYLMISAGGAIGGLFVALVAPFVFDNFYELHLGLVAMAVLLIAVCLRDREALSPRRWLLLAVLLVATATVATDRLLAGGWLGFTAQRWLVWTGGGVLVAGGLLAAWRGLALNWHRVTCGLLGAGLVGLVVALGHHMRQAGEGALLKARNFYGVLSVLEYRKEEPDAHYYTLLHGRITHGLQFAAADRAAMITSYFGPRTGIALAIKNFPRQENQRIGLLGLGVGTIAAYGKPGDYLRIYEIDPQVKAIAEKPFSYVALSKAKIDIVMGDGRLSMENEPAQNFDFLIMDAFSSDAVPVHLLTREAFEIYLRHLKPDGAILVNISNRYLDLRPVVENAARAFGLRAHTIASEDGDSGDGEEGAWWLYGATWMVLSRNEAFMAHRELTTVALPPAPANTIPLWTDDYTSMFRILQ
ncbi:MAG: fused MFS/spermidine synthase [Opitutaceae bacterium]|nr:fused MFS/spermidine synthase [Opitutaceae bacterium]